MKNKLENISAYYFLSQGLAGLVWWIVLIVSPPCRKMFLPIGVQEITLMGFWLADFIFFILGSLYIAFMLFMGKRIKAEMLWFIAGGISYAAVYCLGLSVIANGGWLSTVIMLSAMSLSLFFVNEINDE